MLICKKTPRECPDCVIPFDPAKMCKSCEMQLRKLSDADLQSKGRQTAAFAQRAFSTSALLDDMHATLKSLASIGVPFPVASNTSQGPTLMRGGEFIKVDGRRLHRITCRDLKQMHRVRLGKGRSWQVDEWFDGECNIRDTGYLQFMAI